MCRLFGFRSNASSRVHRSLVHAQNSLRQQSVEHKDGWGIAYYAEDAGKPAVAHGLGAAHQDPEFDRVSGLVDSHAVLAHVRLASVGPVELHNSHPFIHGTWAFAHNGTVREFSKYRPQIEAEIAPDFRELIRGDTDSERLFYLVLTALREEVALDGPVTAEQLAKALCRTAQCASRITHETQAAKPTSVNLMATNGAVMAATRRHRTLFFSEGKPIGGAHRHTQPGERVSQIVISSEALSQESHWHEIPEEGVIALEPDLTLRRWTIGELAEF